VTLPNPQYIALYAAALSALVAAFSYVTKVRHERLRTLRVVLYLFLSFYEKTASAAASIEANPQTMIAALELSLKRYDFQPEEGILAKIRDNFARQMRDSCLSQFAKDCEGLIEPLDKALRDLARDDPLLAHRLDVTALLRMKHERADFGPDDGTGVRLDGTRLAETMDQAAENALWLPLLVTSAFMTKNAARHCGLLTWLRVTRHLRRPRPAVDIHGISTLLEPAFTAVLNEAIAQVEQAAGDAVHYGGET
jgi:hypothetical protein